MKSYMKGFASVLLLNAALALAVVFGVLSPDAAGAAVLAQTAVMPSGAFPNMDSFRAHMVTQLGQIEVIRQSLYDTVLYPTAGMVNLRFFQNPIGQGLSASPGNANAVKSLTDTNMEAAGALPAPQGFWIQSIEVIVTPGAVNTANTFTERPFNYTGAGAAAATVQAGANDVKSIIASGALQLTIGEKPYLKEAPLFRFPSKARVEYDGAISTQAQVADVIIGKEWARSAGRPYILEPGLSLMTSQNFNVQLLWPVVVATPSGFNAKVQVVLDGWLFRGVQ